MEKRQRNTIIGLVAVVVLGGLIWWGNQQNENGIVSQEIVKVGVVAPLLTGPLADYGIAFKNGFELASEEADNEKVQFVFEDSEYDPKKAISAFRKLTEVDNVALAIDWGAPTTQAVAPLVETAQTPFIAITIDPSITQVSDLIIRGDLNRPEDFAEKMWEYLRERNLKNIAVVHTENVFLNIMLKAFQDTKDPSEKVTIIDTYQFGDKDFRTSIAKIKDENYDALGVYLVSGQISQFYIQAKQLGLSIETFGTDFFESQSEIDAARGAMDGAVYTNMDVAEEFKEKYQDRFGNQSQIGYAGGGYDLANLLMQEVNFENTNSTLDSLKSLSSFNGVRGRYQYMETENDRYFSKPTYIKKIVGSQIETINE